MDGDRARYWRGVQLTKVAGELTNVVLLAQADGRHINCDFFDAHHERGLAEVLKLVGLTHFRGERGHDSIGGGNMEDVVNDNCEGREVGHGDFEIHARIRKGLGVLQL